jgi:hypothetical protein
MKHASLLAIVITILAPSALGAHRLDEYLQATRVGIERQRVTLEIDLTPGVSVARQVTAWIDSDGNRVISLPESLAYGRRVLDALSLTVDGRAVSPELGDVEAPSVADIDAGTGTLRLRASAVIPSMRTGRHELTLVNSHHPETSVYLANALVPSDTAIQVVDQRRTVDQHSFTIAYDVGMPASWTRAAWGLCALGLVFVTAATRRGLGRSRIYRRRPN